MLENQAISRQDERCGCRSGVVAVLEQLVNEVRLIGVLVHHAPLNATHGRLLQRVRILGAVLRQGVEPPSLLEEH